MKEERYPVLSAKYKIPSPRERSILREDLMKRLRQIPENSVTVLKAGAGSGKTTLLSLYVRERDLGNIRWITMDQGMNQVFVFWNYIMQALSAFLKDGEDSLRKCFEGNVQREMLTQILAIFAERLKDSSEIILVLDDFQYIGDQFLLETLDQFLRIMPDNLHLVILSREMPGIYMGSLYMEGRLLLIDEESMRLTGEECRQFLSYTLGLSLGEEQLKTIVAGANGWIGGAQLMAIAARIQPSSGAVYASADKQVIYGYIEKEIFSSLSEEEKQFLKKTALLNYFNEEICRAYIPEAHFEHMMQAILEKNLFVIQVDREQKEYRYHAILRDFLLHVMEAHPKQKRELCIHAAQVFYERQDYDECVRLLFECKAYEPLMEKLLVMPQNAITFSYMMEIPKEQITKNVNFAYQYFFCYYAALEMKQCNQIYQYIRENLGEDETFGAFHHANLFFDINWEFRDIPIMTLEQIEQLSLNAVTKAYLLIKEAYFLFLADLVPDAMEYLNRAELIYTQTRNVYIESFVLAVKTQILEAYGELKQALYLYERMKSMMEEVPTMQASYYIGIAGLHLKQKRLKEAETELKLAKDVMEQGVETINSAYLYTIAEWYYVSGQPEKTEEIIRSLAQEKIYQSVFFSARLLLYPVYRGNDQKLSESFLSNYETAEENMKNMDTDLLYAGILYENVDRTRALKQIDQLVARARKVKNKLKIIEGTLMKAHFLFAENPDDRRVLNLLVEAVTYAYPEQIVLPFWFEKEHLSGILQRKEAELEQLLEEREWNFLYAALTEEEQESGTGASDRTGASDGTEILTEREWEVLQEIEKGYSNRLIAEHLCISVATVKTHLINIYGKLGVNNRMAAVNRMKQGKPYA